MDQRSEHAVVMERHPIAGKPSVAEIRHAVRDRLDDLRIDPVLAYDCLIAVTEACTNALIHGKRNGSTPCISWQIDSSEAQFFVESFSGREWSISDQPMFSNADPTLNPIAGRVGGFGLHLMADLMDEVDVSISTESTKVTMTKRLAAQAS